MPLITYKCECGNTENKFIRKPKEAPITLSCNKCGKESKKMLSAPSSGSKIVIDTPGMARRIEVVPDIIELNKQRTDKDYSKD